MDEIKTGDAGWDMLDEENNEGEFLIALRNINKAIERGVPQATAMKRHGIPGHPYFAAYWPVTKFWGDAAAVRKQRHNKGPNDD
jgi:hypothetical protein